MVLVVEADCGTFLLMEMVNEVVWGFLVVKGCVEIL